MASIFHNPSAFEPMYDDAVVVRSSSANGLSNLETTVRACVFTASDGEALSGEAVDADREDIAVGIRDDDWRYFARLRLGDKLVWNGSEYAFVSAKRDAVMGWVVRARSTGGAT